MAEQKERELEMQKSEKQYLEIKNQEQLKLIQEKDKLIAELLIPKEFSRSEIPASLKKDRFEDSENDE